MARRDPLTRYVYGLNVHCGKKEGQTDETVGERVVCKLTSSIRKPDVVVCFDSFFISVLLMTTLQYAAVGTCISRPINVPIGQGKLEKS